MIDTPFAYSDDFALFPHMPKNVPGFDCRLPAIMGDWMVSIPARRKNTSVWEFGVPLGGTCINGNRNLCDDEPQPYEEVLPSESGYATALADAEQRLTMYHSGTPSWMNPGFGPFVSRYTYCPDTSDIVDPSILWGRTNACSPKLVPLSGTDYDIVSNVLVQPDLGVPLHAHWVPTDLTQAPGDWSPRRTDWERILVEQKFPTISGADCSLDLQKQASEKTVVELLQDVTVTPTMKEYALSAIPFGLWQTKSSCDLSAYPTIGELSEAPKWTEQVQPAAKQGSRVYAEPPGAAVFNMVCTNCHGPSADSLGRMASNLMTMTGGALQVMTWRTGRREVQSTQVWRSFCTSTRLSRMGSSRCRPMITASSSRSERFRCRFSIAPAPRHFPRKELREQRYCLAANDRTRATSASTTSGFDFRSRLAGIM